LLGWTRKNGAKRPWVIAGAALILGLAAAAVVGGIARTHSGKEPPTDPPKTIVAGFAARSYPSGGFARLVVRTRVRRLAVQLFHYGPPSRAARRGAMRLGAPVTRPQAVSWRSDAATLSIPMRLGAWTSGLYFARLTARSGLVGYAPFVLRPRVLGRVRVAVVLPTNTWQAYNLRDGATWYFDTSVHDVDLSRPYLDRGIPPHFRAYDEGFLRWFARAGRKADFLADDDLEAISSGRRLAQLYDLVVFSGHEEYVTPHVYDIVERYRDVGGNLGFLSSNNFFYRVTKDGNTMHGRTRWRDIGRPEARLIGIQYIDWYHGHYPNRPYVVDGARAAPWFFRGTGLLNGDRFGRYGIEVDGRTDDSPPGVVVLASARNIFGNGVTADMTYYERGGAKVFAAGVTNFGGSALFPVPSRLLANLWAKLARP
jgi:hypothetical protein